MKGCVLTTTEELDVEDGGRRVLGAISNRESYAGESFVKKGVSENEVGLIKHTCIVVQHRK